MLDIGWSELLLIGVVALIVVGPKDLPKLFHALGQFTAKARSMARDFQRAMEQAAREAGGDDIANIAQDLKSISSPRSMGLDALSAASKKLDAWDQTKRSATAGEPAAELGPATAELAAKVKANGAAAEARAAELAAFKDIPTAEELAEATHEPSLDAQPAKTKPARKPRAKAAAPAPETAAETAAKPARKPRKKSAAAAEAATPKAPRTRRRKAETAMEAEVAPTPAAAAAPKPRAKRSTARKTDA